MTISRSFTSGAALALTLALHPGRAEAAPEPRGGADADAAFQAHYQRALSRYSEERYEEAIEAFQAAYELRQLPRLIFNLAQAHRHLGRAREALRYYELYQVKEPNPKPGLRAELDLYISQMRAIVQTAERAQRAQEQEEQAGSVSASPAAIGQPAPAAGAGRRAPGSAAAEPPTPEAGETRRRVLLAMTGSSTAPFDLRLSPPPSGPGPAAAPAVQVPLHRRWWLWTIVGGVVAAGATTGLAVGLSRPSSVPDPPGLDVRTILF